MFLSLEMLQKTRFYVWKCYKIIHFYLWKCYKKTCFYLWKYYKKMYLCSVNKHLNLCFTGK